MRSAHDPKPDIFGFVQYAQLLFDPIALNLGGVAMHLGIIVPYRDRQAHLDEFLPSFAAHAAKYPTKVPQGVAIKVIEQTPERDFNRGKLKNVGYVLSKDQADYICFHDVDYCPERADYRPPSPGFWAHLAYKGPERIVDPRGIEVRHDMRNFIGGVILFAKKEFEQVNGFANSYWGWGYEDSDLRGRCTLVGIALDRRHGRFRILPHINDGFELADGLVIESAASVKNKALANSRFPPPPLDAGMTMDDRLARSEIRKDGISNLTFSIVSREWLRPDADHFSVEKITVSI